MAMITCPECSEQISDKAKACPKCGYRKKKTKWWLWVPLAAIVLFAGSGIVAGRLSSIRVKEAALEAVGHVGDPRFAAAVTRWGERYASGRRLVCVFVTDKVSGGDFAQFVIIEVDGPFETIVQVTTEANAAAHRVMYDMVCK